MLRGHPTTEISVYLTTGSLWNRAEQVCLSLWEMLHSENDGIWEQAGNATGMSPATLSIHSKTGSPSTNPALKLKLQTGYKQPKETKNMH